MKNLINTPQAQDANIVKNIKVEAIGKFLTKLKRPANYNLQLLEEINKFSLKNYRDDLANSLGEAVNSKFDVAMMIRVLVVIWNSYPDDEYRYGLFANLDKFLLDKNVELSKGLNLEVRQQIFKLYFELYIIGFPVNLKSLIQTFVKCVG